jgi:hypothetical protein
MFSELLARGRESGEEAAFMQALRLWRGVPFAGVPGPFAEAERARAEELRLCAVEGLAAVRLRLGRASEVVADLNVLIRDHPMRERLRELEMLGLYRSGRQADAIQAYAEARRLLVDQLGIEPGPDLQRLHQQILTNDPGLATDSIAAVALALPNERPTAQTGQPDPGSVGPSLPVPQPIEAASSPRWAGRGQRAIRGARHRIVRNVVLAVATLLSIIVMAGSAALPPTRSLAQAHNVVPTTANIPVRYPLPGDDDQFIADVTIPDGTDIVVSQTFTKVWAIRNTGTVTWHERRLLRQGLLDGPGLCSSPAEVPVPDTQPGSIVEISVTLVAPRYPGSCEVNWKMVDDQGRLCFPNKNGLYLTVNIVDPGVGHPPSLTK